MNRDDFMAETKKIMDESPFYLDNEIVRKLEFLIADMTGREPACKVRADRARLIAKLEEERR